MLAKALQGKAEKAGSPTEALRLISQVCARFVSLREEKNCPQESWFDFPHQALCFADEIEVRDSLLRKRILLLQGAGLEKSN